MPDRKSPSITKSLLDWMDELWPDRAPRKGETHDEMLFAAGAVSVVRRLKTEYERQKGAE